MMLGLSSLARKISGVSVLKGTDVAGFDALNPERKLLAKGATLATAQSDQPNTYLICSGWASCHRLLHNGNKQLLLVLMPGDFVCLDAIIWPNADRTIEAQTPITLLSFDVKKLRHAFETNQGIRDIVLWAFTQEASMLAEHLLCLGRRPAYERTLHLLLELWVRLHQIHACSGTTYRMPLTLSNLADALGLSEVHLSRTVQKLRGDGLSTIDFSERTVTLASPALAAEMCAFDPAYLKFYPTPEAKALLPG